MPAKGSAKKTESIKTKEPKYSGKKTAETVSRSMPKAGKDPKGGLTAKGREYFAKKEGSHLRPGVQGPADTPEKMVRKGSFLRRHFANPRGPMKDEKGEPTRLALSAHAWGEEVPQNMNDAKTLAAEGHELLEQYHAAKEGKAGTGGGKKASAVAKQSAKAARNGKGAAKHAAGNFAKIAAKAVKTSSKKTAGKKAGTKKSTQRS